MKVLVIGDEHTYGYGLSGGNLSYIGHFIRQISHAGRAVSVEAYAHLTMAQTIATLAQLPLNRYDLIVLQLDYTLIQEASSPFLVSPVANASICPSQTKDTTPGLTTQLKAIGAGLLSLLRTPHERTSISVLLNQLRPYRHNVLLLTPFPHLNPVSRWLRRRSRSVLLREADRRLVSVFDTDQVIRSREEYFLPADTQHLNAISHELLGRSLFDFYQSAPTIITIQAYRKE